LLIASLANFLTHNDYPLLRTEVMLPVLGIAVFAAVAAVLYSVMGRVGRSILEGLLAALFVELNTVSLTLALIVGVAVAAISFFKRSSLVGPMAVFGAVVLITTIAGLGGRVPWLRTTEGRSAPANASLPAVVHLILDEHIGIDGLPTGDADAMRLKRELAAFYQRSGFDVYGGAYSEHVRTANSIPYALNFGQRLGRDMSEEPVIIGPTSYLEGLVQRGYRLTIIQPDFADYCTGARFSECVTYQSSSPSALLPMPLSTAERAGLITAKFLSLSKIVGAALRPYRLVAGVLHLPKLDPANLGRSTSIATLAMTDDLNDRLAKARPGDAYFAHVLLPHYPYAVDENCRVLPWRSWKKPFAPRNLDVRQHAYFAQVRCTTRRIGLALQALSRSPAGANAVVIIHGDHGSRITQFDPTPAKVGKFSDRDLISSYSTLFAIRFPKVQPGVSSGRRPIQDLLKDFAATQFTKAPDDAQKSPAVVYLDAGPKERPLQRTPLPAY
jgi:hypothetical protein